MSASGGPLWRGVFQAELSMRSHVSWRASGAAARAYTPCDRADLAAFLSCLRADEPLLVVGLGSNLLIRDGGYSGTVIFLHGVLRELRVEGDCCFAEAGVASPKLGRHSRYRRRCAGDECRLPWRRNVALRGTRADDEAQR